jgi:hypothetical protein
VGSNPPPDVASGLVSGSGVDSCATVKVVDAMLIVVGIVEKSSSFFLLVVFFEFAAVPAPALTRFQKRLGGIDHG